MPRRPPHTGSSDDYAAALSAMGADEAEERSVAPPADPALPPVHQDLPPTDAPRRPRRADRNRGALGAARTTIPLCLVLGALLPLLGVGWFLVEPASPLRIMGPWLAWVLIGFGLFCAGSAVLLMRYVARQVA